MAYTFIKLFNFGEAEGFVCGDCLRKDVKFPTGAVAVGSAFVLLSIVPPFGAYLYNLIEYMAGGNWMRLLLHPAPIVIGLAVIYSSLSLWFRDKSTSPENQYINASQRLAAAYGAALKEQSMAVREKLGVKDISTLAWNTKVVEFHGP